MKYDFTKMANRRNLPSVKWRTMLSDNPNIPEGIVPFTVADMEFKNPPEIINGLKKYLDETVLGYTYANDDFKNALAGWMEKRHNFKISEDWLINTSGVVTGFFAAVGAFSKEGEGVVIMPPVYPPFFLSAQVKNRKLLECPLVNTDGYHEIDFDKLETIFKNESPKVLIFCSPHNPIGRVWKKTELEQLANLCLKYKVLIVADEIHHDLVMPGYKHTVLQTLSDEVADNCITCTSLSKTFNLAGMGLSSLFIRNKDIREKLNLELEKSSSKVMSNLSFKSNELAYNNCETWLEELIQVIDVNQRLVNSWAEKTKIKARLIEGTYLQWLDFRALNMSDDDLINFLHTKAHLYLKEGYAFGKEGVGFQRLNLAVPTKTLEDALNRLSKALQSEGK